MSTPDKSLHQTVYRPDIDGMRAIAVSLVVLYHAFPSKVTGGFVGVDIFFVISGYLITGIILRDLHSDTFSFVSFYARRFRRIVPALAVVLVATLILGAYCLLPSELGNLGRQVWAGAAFVSNIQLWQEAGYFDAAAETKPLLHLWSLGVEEQFYALWPPLLLIAYRYGVSTVWMFASLAIASFALNVAGISHHAGATFYLLPTRLWELAVGGWLCRIETGRVAPGAAAFAENIGACLGLAAILLVGLELHSSVGFPGWWAAVPVLATALLISAGPRVWINRVILSSRPAVFVGLISYPLYLWHWPLLSFARIVEQDVPARRIRSGAVVVSVALAWLTWRLIERPTRDSMFAFKDSKTKMRFCITACLVALAAITAGGILTQRRQGFPSLFQARFPELATKGDDLVEVPDPGAVFPHCAGSLSPGAVLSWCLVSSTEAPDVALFGDSHAFYMFPGFAREFSRRGVNTLVVGESSCAPLTGVKSFLKGRAEQCADANRRAVDLLVATPSVRTVVLSSLGPYYFSGVSFASDHIGVSDASNWVMEASDPSFHGSKEDLFLSGLSATIGKLETAGKHVVFFIDVPELDFRPSACIDTRPVRLTVKPVRSPCGVGIASVASRQSVYRSILARLQSAHPSMRVFDPLPYLCDAGVCSAINAGHFVYRDSNHLSVFGSAYLSDKLAGWLAIDAGQHARVRSDRRLGWHA